MAMTLTGFVYDNSGNAVSGATVQGYVSADAATTTAESSTTTNSDGKWSITTSTAARIPMDVKITYGANIRWLKAGDGINVTNLTASGVVTVGEDDVGYDVKFHGASAGAYMEWDESVDQLRIMGASADATTSTGKLLLATSLTNINANDVIGKIEFQTPHEAGGTDATTIAAAIEAVAQGTFAADLNSTDIIFKTGHSEAATEKFRFTSQGEIGIGGATYGSSGDVLTSGGAGAAPTWATPTTGDITGVTAGVGLSGGGASGSVTLTLDLSELSSVTPANGDSLSTLDSDGGNEQLTTVANLATLFAGTGLSASSSVLSVDAAQTQITSVGTIGTGVWQGTAIGSSYIAGDAITGAKIADTAIDSEHITAGAIDNGHLADDAVDSDELAAGAVDTAHIGDNQVTVAKLEDIARGSIIYGNASAASAELTVGSANYVLKSDGTDIAWADSSSLGTSTGKAIAFALVF